MPLSKKQIFDFLEEKYSLYNNVSFIENDPVQIPHLFSKKEDIEISGFLTASIAWGQRKTIINNSIKLIKIMDYAPYEYIMNAKKQDYKLLDGFVHRTFNTSDCLYFLQSLRNIYKKHGGLENVFSKKESIEDALIHFRKIFFEITPEKRTYKHVSDITKGASAKRLNMYLRWMVRKDKRGVDFGLWNKISPANLFLPLDIHTGNVARKLGILKRQQSDWKAVCELTGYLRELCPEDPVKYDFALFGLGISEKF
ncbi:MAG: TIGR02757 family protein [Bacteroidetes bacterium GWF2_38_335]|nr:MAG: TIGR02757 family protein [Bacteroidetes bacterium GWF2_38_335]OFY78060.1 MAG: TIGR02757 family protein [Bacteroidetes bacterium RIFOXYA12_FULL_38_20]HBS88332.1 TIGR02757 family protein [Bacteroidales bacterium]